MIVRTSEYKKMEQIYQMDRNQLVVLYGARGCQKEQLLQNFCKDKKFFYYRCRNASPQEQLRQLQKTVEQQYRITLYKDTYDECFNRIKSGDTSKLVVIIDEFQNAAKKDAALFESILKLKAKRLYPGPVMILLCNSSLTWTEREMDTCLGEGSKKIDHRIRLNEVGFLDVVRAFPEYSVEQCVEAYGVLGGVPEYLNRWDGKRSIKENICRHILHPDGYLFAEAEAYIGTELRELSVYDTILASIARGNEKLNDLFLDTGYSRAKISVYMKNLAAFDVVEKVVSFETGGWDNAKKGIYAIKHPYVNFWFRFIYPHLSELFILTPEDFYDRFIAPELEEYLHRYFVKVCQEYLSLMNMVGKVPVKLTKMGIWLGKTGTIDIIGQDEARNSVVGICNWSKEYLTYEQYEELLATMKKARISAHTIYLFSAKEFDEKLHDVAEKHTDIVLVDMKEL